VILKPVVANPLLFLLIFSSAKIYFVLFAYVLPWILYALFFGIKPEYPGRCPAFGSVDSYIM